MLKVQQSNGSDYQRGPTRFSSSFKPPQTSTSSHQDLLQNKSKLSTLTRIPLVPKGSIRPPVERNTTSNPNNALSEQASNRLITSRVQTSRIRPNSLALNGGREISSSTSKLASNSRIGTSVLQRISSRTAKKTDNSNSRNDPELAKSKSKITGEDVQEVKSPSCLFSDRQVERRPNGIGERSRANSGQSQISASRLGRLKNLVAVVHPQHSQRVNPNSATRVNKLAIMKPTTAPASTPTSERKIESEKVGSSYHKRDAHNKDRGASNSGTVARPDKRTRSERGEGKQDGGQIIVHHPGIKDGLTTTDGACTTLDATTNLHCPITTIATTTSAAARQMTSSPHHYSSCCSSASSASSTSPSYSCPTSEEEDKSDQFTLNNNNNNNNSSSSNNININNNNNDNPTMLLLSVASNNGDLHEDKKGRHGNNKQSNKHLSARTYPSATSMATTTTTSMASSPQSQQSLCCRSPAYDNNNCYSNKHDGAKSTGLTKTQDSAAASISFKRNATKISKTINNDHLLPKPLGQQVLSLMMLDVGLLPANGSGNDASSGACGSVHNQHLQLRQQQQLTLTPKPRRTHVRVQSPTREDIIGFSSTNIGNVNSHLLDNNRSFINHHERDPAKRLNNHSNDCLDHGLSNNFHALHQQQLPPITTATAHEMMKLQVRLSYQDNESLRSVSLPSSPRIGFRAVNNNQTRDDKSFIGSDFWRSTQDPIRYTPQDHSTGLTNQPYPNNFQYQARQARNNNDNLISICDNHESNSLSSSSCSSLNHFPPLLALSNQLDVLRFEEFVSKANINLNTESQSRQNQQERYLFGTNSGSPTISCQNSANDCPKISTSLTLDREAQTEEQQEQTLTDVSSNPKLGKKPHLNEKINHKRECSKQIDETRISSREDYSDELEIENTGRDSSSQRKYQSNDQRPNSQVQPSDLVHNDESCSDQQLRRQQQRSHSISGQEFHSNGGYHRLKQSLYNGQQQHQHLGAFDGYQNYGAQSATGGRLQQIPSPYQQHPHAGRSPSPLSINCPSAQYGSPFRDAKQYPLDPSNSGGSRLPRNQLHASLECLNTTTTYPDYHQVQRLQEQQQQLLHHQHHHNQQQQLHNQHYAASYVLTSPPANTIINSNGEQDLAAAAMGTPPSQCHTMNMSPPQQLNMGPATYSHQTQNLINRAMAQVSQSPMRRIGLNNPQGTLPGLLSQISSHNHPMRAGHSSLSLASSSFIIEDKLQNEIRKLQSELKSEKEKNEALNSQLNINSNLMAAFEQSLTTLNTRLRQLTTLNEKKDNEIEDLKEQLRSSKILDLNRDKVSSPRDEIQQTDDDNEDWAASSEIDSNSERSMMIKTIEDLKKQLIEKDRLLTDTRLEALSAAHQLEQLESKLNGEHSILANEDELDEGVMVVNHSPSDSDAITDSAHFSEINSQISKSNQQCNEDTGSFNNISNNTITNNNNNNLMGSSNEENITDDHHSNHSSDYQIEARGSDQHQQQTLPNSISQQFNETDSGVVCKLMDGMLKSMPI